MPRRHLGHRLTGQHLLHRLVPVLDQPITISAQSRPPRDPLPRKGDRSTTAISRMSLYKRVSHVLRHHTSSGTTPDDLAYFYAFIPPGPPPLLSRLIRIAGIRWTSGGEDFQQSKGQAGLDQTQVRRYRSWRRTSSWPWRPSLFKIGIVRHNRHHREPWAGPTRVRRWPRS